MRPLQVADRSPGAAPLDAAAIATVRRSPVVDPGGVTFVYHGAADAVNLRCWIHGLPASQPFERVGESDLWVLRVELPENSRIEYKFEVVHDGQEEWILDPLNPLQAADPFGANSVAQGQGYVRPEWTLADPAARAGVVDEMRCRYRLDDDRRVAVTCPRFGAAVAIRCWSCTTATTTCATRICSRSSTT
jgi:hypothetical protein